MGGWTPRNKNRMCAPQASPAAGRTRMEDRGLSYLCLQSRVHGRGDKSSMSLEAHPGETRFSSAPRGPHAKESHASRLFSNQTGLQSFDFEMNAAWRAKSRRPVLGPERTRCAFGGQTASQRHPSWEGTGSERGRWETGLSLSVCPGPGATGDLEDVTPSKCFFLDRKDLFLCFLFRLYVSLFSHRLFSLKGWAVARRKFSPRMSFPENALQTRAVCAVLSAG